MVTAPPRLDDIHAALDRIAGGVRETPLERSRWLGEVAGREVLLKLECQQRTGSFKARGAMNAVASLTRAERARGVVTASAGNHGLGVALAAAEHEASARIFVPKSAPRVKVSRIRELGAEVVPVEGGYDAAEAAAKREAAAGGGVYVHAYSDPAVVAGQGTVGLEIAATRPDAATLLVPVGGGGLIGGIGIVARALLPEARVVGVQSTYTSAMAASLAAGELRSGPTGPTICDGLAGDTNEVSLRLARRVVDEMVIVDEPMVGEAVLRLHEHEGVLAEGSAAVVVAALLDGLVAGGTGPIVAVLTGGNIDLAAACRLLSS